MRVALPELEGQGYFELLDEVYRTGRPHIATEASVFVRRAPEVLTFIYQPIRNASGAVTGIFVEVSDVTDASRADGRRKETERLARSTMDALGEHIAVVDESGTILAVNAAWRAFAARAAAAPASVCEGANYLSACDRAAAGGDPVAGEVAALIRRVASGAIPVADLEYACPTPDGTLWFNIRISRFRDDGPTRIVVTHEDITARRTDEERIEYLATHDALTGLPNRHLQIAVVGVGKVEIGAYLPVPLTHIYLPRRETGERAAELAIALSRGGPVAGRVLRCLWPSLRVKAASDRRGRVRAASSPL